MHYATLLYFLYQNKEQSIWKFTEDAVHGNTLQCTFLKNKYNVILQGIRRGFDELSMFEVSS